MWYMHWRFIRHFALTYGGLWHSLWYEHIPSCWRLFLSTISVPVKKQQQRRVLISLVMELWQKNLSRQAGVNPDKNCACEGEVHLQNKAVYCASRIKKGCVGERSAWGLLHKDLYIFIFFFLSNVIQQLKMYCTSTCKTRACTSAHMLMRHESQLLCCWRNKKKTHLRFRLKHKTG